MVLPSSGKIFVSVADRHKDQIVPLAKRLHQLGYELLCTSGTARKLEEAGVPTERVKKLVEGPDFEAVGIDAGLRPEQVSIADYVRLSNYLRQKSG